MSSKQRTREKLMGSMRKTKAGAGIETKDKSEPTSVTQASAPKSVKPRTKSASRATPGPQSRIISPDGYQSGRRVWPD